METKCREILKGLLRIRIVSSSTKSGATILAYKSNLLIFAHYAREACLTDDVPILTFGYPRFYNYSAKERRDRNVNKYNGNGELFGIFCISKSGRQVSRVTRVEANTPRWIFHG